LLCFHSLPGVPRSILICTYNARCKLVVTSSRSRSKYAAIDCAMEPDLEGDAFRPYRDGQDDPLMHRLRTALVTNRCFQNILAQGSWPHTSFRDRSTGKRPWSFVWVEDGIAFSTLGFVVSSAAVFALVRFSPDCRIVLLSRASLSSYNQPGGQPRMSDPSARERVAKEIAKAVHKPFNR
jgi:hypothetical protein